MVSCIFPSLKVTLSSLHEQLNGSPFDQPAEIEKSFDAPLLKSASTVYGELLSVSALLLTSCEELLSDEEPQPPIDITIIVRIDIAKTFFILITSE